MYDACCRNVALPRSDRVSMAMRACAAANTAFMVGMYCEGELSLTETTKMRACRPAKPPPPGTEAALPPPGPAPEVVEGEDLVAEEGVGPVELDVGAKRRAVLLMCARARVKAPEICVVVVEVMSSVVVAVMRLRREERRERSICAKRGYLFAGDGGCCLLFEKEASRISMSSFGLFDFRDP